MHGLYNLKKMAISELEMFADRYNQRGELSRSEWEEVDLVAHAAKNLCKIIEACEDEEAGYSSAARFNVRGTYSNENRGGYSNEGRGGYSNEGRGGYSNEGRGGYSGRRDSMGRYSRDNEHLRETLMELRDTTSDDMLRNELQGFIDKMARMK